MFFKMYVHISQHFTVNCSNKPAKSKHIYIYCQNLNQVTPTFVVNLENITFLLRGKVYVDVVKLTL